MGACLRSPIGSGMGLHTRPLPRLAASWWSMRSHARPLRLRRISTTLPYLLYDASGLPPPLLLAVLSRRGQCLPCGAGVASPRSTLPHVGIRYTHCARVFAAPPHSTLLHLRAPSTSTCAPVSLAAGVRATQRRPLPSCTCARRLRPPARLHPCRRASARPNTAFRPMSHLSFRGAMHFSADRNRVIPAPR
ncbi:hypothetical protein B0H13DRAFT_2121506 [Mycena leptocephala]|nr:hypothetical protein B0H13DRAFT_2121506 [Mycena leptocephala]